MMREIIWHADCKLGNRSIPAPRLFHCGFAMRFAFHGGGQWQTLVEEVGAIVKK